MNNSDHSTRHFSKSLGGLSSLIIRGVSVYVTYCSCSSNTVSKVWFTGKQ